VNPNTDSIVCYGCGKLITKGEEEQHLIVPTKSHGLAEGDNRQDVCKACKTSKNVPVNFTFKMFQVEKMRRKAGIKATDIPKWDSATGLAAYIKKLVHKDISCIEDSSTDFVIQFTYPELKELSREVRNLRRYLNRTLPNQMKKIVEELTDPFDSRLEVIDKEIIRVKNEPISTLTEQANKDIFDSKAKIDPDPLDED